MVKKRAGLLLIAGSFSIALVSAACAPTSDSGNNATPTPTQSQTPTATPTISPTPTPLAADIVTAQNWVTPDGKEMWVRFQTGFPGTIKNIGTSTTPPSSCANIQTDVALTATNFGFVELVLSSAAGEVQGCGTGVHHWDIDYLDDNTPGCSGQPCVNKELIFDSTASNTFFDNGIFGTVTAESGNDTGNLRFTINNPLQTGRVVTLLSFDVYLNNGFVPSVPSKCGPFAVTLSPSASPALLEPCVGNPLTVAGNYKVYFRGVYDDDLSDFAQYITFAYTP